MNNQNEISVKYKIDNNEIKLTPKIVQEYLVGSTATITLPEFKMFTELCKVQKLNPFLKEAYLIKFGNKPAQIVVGKDVILKRAILHPQYDGKESGLIVKNETGEIIERKGCFYDYNSESLLGAWCNVFRKDRSHPEYMSISLNEVAQKKKDGTLNTNWSSKTATMLEKVAKVRALRESFVDEFQGMYDADEFHQDRPIENIEEVQTNDFDEETIIEVESKEVETVNMDEL